MKNYILAILVLLIFSCKEYVIEDYYRAFPGTVKIIKIIDSQYNPSGKNMYSDIFMNFIPNDINARQNYKFKDWKDESVQLSHKSRMNHYKPWIKKNKIEKGNRYIAIRYEKYRGFGTSTPVIFRVFLDKQLK